MSKQSERIADALEQHLRDISRSIDYIETPDWKHLLSGLAEDMNPCRATLNVGKLAEVIRQFIKEDEASLDEIQVHIIPSTIVAPSTVDSKRSHRANYVFLCRQQYDLLCRTDLLELRLALDSRFKVPGYQLKEITKQLDTEKNRLQLNLYFDQKLAKKQKK